ncbi:conjugal transfer pilus assembly protein TraU (plasmid) [Desulfosarcina sp. BuS5]|nr:conjugal transfer pilus assembly protein TraU [Desulfosarcina sp. BuS5]
MRFKKLLFIVLLISQLLISQLFINYTACYALCKNKRLNPMKDTCWDCIYPIKIADMTIKGGTGGDPHSGGNKMKGGSSMGGSTNTKKSTCKCKYGKFYRYGITFSMWEPNRYIEVVKDPYCLPSQGGKQTKKTSNKGKLKKGYLHGGINTGGASQEGTNTFFQVHYFIWPIWKMMETMVDSNCIESSSGYDLYYMTESDPTWNDDELALKVYPEATLFANMPSQLSCIADSITAQFGYPLWPLFWCMGSWGSTYPMSGHMNEDETIEGAAGAGARIIYKLARMGAICDVAINLCYCISSLIWIKSHYRFTNVKPVKGSSCIPIGRSSMLWGINKNPGLSDGQDSPDNFMFIIFRYRKCCLW